jgi:hypothetical protein
VHPQGFSGHKGDIISSFIIIGKNIKKIELYIGNTLIITFRYLNVGLINFKPLIDGIIIRLLYFSSIKLKIYGDYVDNVYARVLYCDLNNMYKFNSFNYWISQTYGNKRKLICFQGMICNSVNI